MVTGSFFSRTITAGALIWTLSSPFNSEVKDGWSYKVKVKVTFVQALLPCKGRTAHRGSRSIALPFHDHGTRRGEGSASHPGHSLPPWKDPVPIVQEAGWAPGPVWTGAENLAPPSPGFDPQTIQPVASRYTDWATRPTLELLLLPICRTSCVTLQPSGMFYFPVIYFEFNCRWKWYIPWILPVVLRLLILQETGHDTGRDVSWCIAVRLTVWAEGIMK